MLSHNWLHTADCNTLTKLTLVELSTMYAAAATNDQDINDIFGKGGSHAAPNTVQTGGGPGQRSGQGSTQTGGQRSSQGGGQVGGQSASKPSSGTPSSDSTSSGSAATNFGQSMQSLHPSCKCFSCMTSHPCNSVMTGPHSCMSKYVVGWQSVLGCLSTSSRLELNYQLVSNEVSQLAHASHVPTITRLCWLLMCMQSCIHAIKLLLYARQNME